MLKVGDPREVSAKKNSAAAEYDSRLRGLMLTFFFFGPLQHGCPSLYSLSLVSQDCRSEDSLAVPPLSSLYLFRSKHVPMFYYPLV